MIDEKRKITVGIFNARGLKNKLDVIGHLENDVAVLGVVKRGSNQVTRRLTLV